ncbi:MAG: phosphatidylserine/phosphatidylglycerophosphate/cardiolipin synthase family protein [Myxococcales bacterium]|nr:phosphatidylserine/phosphatidylglycerophosphate/cardiolipin synthase family protein [Myxococcales bacterium]USN51441.1 MAG: phosphatidylserine/phosphatidylglycerophosphate/cardiolipin synthase family protein [Myxococcales bacterium]
MTKINGLEKGAFLNRNQDLDFKKEEINIDATVRDQTISSMEIFGIKISGIKLEDLHYGKLSIDVPLIRGDKNFIGVNNNTSLSIDKNTFAHIEIEVGKNEQNKIVLKNFQIIFSKEIAINNPAAALTKQAKNSPILASIKDALADVKLKKISVGNEGKVFVDGHIQALKIFNKKLAPQITNIKLPQLDENFLIDIGILPSPNNSVSGHLKDISTRFDLRKILRVLGALSGQADFSIEVEGAPSQISLEKADKTLRGKYADFNFKSSGKLDLSSRGELSIVVKKEQNQLLCSLGSFSMGGRLKISPRSKNKFRFDVDGEIDGNISDVKIEGVSKKNLDQALPVRRNIKSAIGKEQEKTPFNYEIGADELHILSQVGVSGRLSSDKKFAKGAARAVLTARNPFVKLGNRGAQLTAHTVVDVGVKDFAIDGRNNFAKAQAKIGVIPGKKLLQDFPELKPLNLDYKITINKEQARIKPPEYGLLRFIRPIVNLEGHHERVNTEITQHPLHSIGSPENFLQVQEITGAQLHDASEVKILIDGTHSMPERLRMIGEAKEQVCFQTLTFKDDSSGWKFAHALVEAQKRGVAVRGIVDSVGNINSIKDLEQTNAIYSYLIANGVDLRIYNNTVEKGLRKIFSITKKYPLLFREPFEKSLSNISGMLDYLEKVVCSIHDDSWKIDLGDRNELAKAIKSIFGGKEFASPHLYVNELKEILSQPMVDTNKMLIALKRVANVSYRSHEKYLIVDGEQAIVGGMNIADEYLGNNDTLVNVDGRMQPAWRDSDVLLRGDIVRDVYKCFRRNWVHIAHERLAFKPKISNDDTKDDNDNVKVSVIQHRPWEDGDDNIVNFFLYNLRTLKPGEKAWFETAYFLPRGILRPLQKELVRAAKRGVDVRILTNSKETSDFKQLVEAAIFDYRELLKAGVKIYQRNQNRTVHAKVAVLGDKLTTIGSYNLDNRSANHDTEDLCAIYDERINQEMYQQLLIDMFEQSDEITLAQIESNPLDKELSAAAKLLLGELF